MLEAGFAAVVAAVWCVGVVAVFAAAWGLAVEPVWAVAAVVRAATRANEDSLEFIVVSV